MPRAIVLFLLAILNGCGTVEKLRPPPPVCVVYDTREVLSNYGGKQTVLDLTKRIDRYLTGYLKENKIEVTQGTCRANIDAVLNVRIDTLELVAKAKAEWLVGTVFVGNAKMNYVATFTARGKTVFEYDDDRNSESLDELARIIASKLTKQVRRYY